MATRAIRNTLVGIPTGLMLFFFAFAAIAFFQDRDMTPDPMEMIAWMFTFLVSLFAGIVERRFFLFN